MDVITEYNMNWGYRVIGPNGTLARGNGFRTQKDAEQAGRQRLGELYNRDVNNFYLSRGCKY